MPCWNYAWPSILSAYDPMDVCGTGGDGKDTFNISTLSCFVVAGAGQRVAKHGNHGVSSACGSSTVLEYLGVKFSNDSSELERAIEQANVCFLHAPLFHPAMKNVAPVRRELGVKTFFNMLGPMTNPAFPKKQLAGVFSLELARLYAYLYQQTDKQFMVVHALDGYDEVSLTGPFKIITAHAEQILNSRSAGTGYRSARSSFGWRQCRRICPNFHECTERRSHVGSETSCDSQCCAGITRSRSCLKPCGGSSSSPRIY